MSEIRVRYATKEDAQAIAVLSRKSFYDAFAAQNTEEDMEKFMRESFSEERLIGQVGAPGNIFLMAFDGDEFVGYVRMLIGHNPEELKDLPAIEIARIYADTAAIGKGVGKALMKRSIEIAVELKMKCIWLGVWEKNERAIEFYTKWGFEKFSEHDFVLGNDVQRDWLMRKLLYGIN